MSTRRLKRMIMSKHELPDGMSVRNAINTDLPGIKELYSQLAPDISNLERDVPIILSDPIVKCMLLYHEQSLIGMVISSVRTMLSCGRKMVIEELVIDNSHRGRGLGSMFVQNCLNYAKALSLDCVELACSLEKPELHKFYEKAGFTHRMRLYSLFL